MLIYYINMLIYICKYIFIYIYVYNVYICSYLFYIYAYVIIQIYISILTYIYIYIFKHTQDETTLSSSNSDVQKLSNYIHEARNYSNSLRKMPHQFASLPPFFCGKWKFIVSRPIWGEQFDKQFCSMIHPHGSKKHLSLPGRYPVKTSTF